MRTFDLAVAERARQAKLAGGGAVDVAAEHAIGHGAHVGTRLDLAPPHHLRQVPVGMAAPREVGELAMEDVEVRKTQRAADHIRRHVEEAGHRQDARRLGPVGRFVEPGAGLDDGLHERDESLGIALRPGLGRTQHLLRHRVPDLPAGRGDAADAEGRGLLVPRLADAVAVDRATREMRHHVRRRHHRKAHVAIRIDAARSEPQAQQVIVRGVGEDRRQRDGRAALARAASDDGGQGAGIERRAGRAMVADMLGRSVLDLPPQRVRQRDRVAVQMQRHRRDHRDVDAVDAQRGRERHRREHVGRVEQADRELVADVGPGDFAEQFDVETVTLVEAEHLREQHGRAVDQGNEPHPHLRSLDLSHQTRLQKKDAPSGRDEATVWDVIVREGRPPLACPKFRSRPSLGASPVVQQETCQPPKAPPRSAKWLIHR